jgi:uncharacterized Fe-S cluster-containing radical SAM superfamily protein
MKKCVNGKRKYFIAELEGSGQVGDVYNKYFRTKDYIKERRGLSTYIKDWLTASLEEVWSPKFLGLNDNGVQKLEFQNPPYVAAQRLGGDPRDYNRVFAIQLNGCTYECAFCFVPREINTPELGKGRYFSAQEIIDFFEKAWKTSIEEGKEVKVIRLTGGEPTSIVPELIVDIWKEIDARDLSDDIYLWVDTNLSTKIYMEKIADELKMVFNQKNVGVVGCLKTIGDGQKGEEDFATITKAHPHFFKNQFDVLSFLVRDLAADVYVYAVPIVTGDRRKIKSRIEACIRRLRQIDENLPLRTNLIHIHYDYDPVGKNLKNAKDEGRRLPLTDEKVVLYVWYNEILPRFYTTEQLSLYMCQVPLRRSWVERRDEGAS